MNIQPQPGPSTIIIDPETDTETVDENELCCVCLKLEPAGLAKKKSVTFVKWT